MSKIEELLKQIGRPYQMLDNEGRYLGCFFPMYFLFPQIPRYTMTKPEDALFENCIDEFYKHCIEIAPDELREGDLLAIDFKGILHVAIYYEFGKIIHIFNGRTLEIGRLKTFKNYKCFRVNK